MKILLCGGGSGGHFYPLIAVAEAIRENIRDRKLLQAYIYYMAPNPYNEGILFDNEIEFIQINGGKIRRYASIQNFFDIIKTIIGFFEALIKVYRIFPDVIFSKGGFSSLPVVLAGKILGIPIIIHEGDSVPGRANKFASKLATKIAIAFKEAEEYFPKEKTAWVGNPIRKEISSVAKDGAYEYLELESATPVIVILGGSLGAQKINDVILSALPELLDSYQVIHQTGALNFKEIETTSKVILEKHENKKRYHLFDYLNPLALKMSAGVANVIISRAGTTIFEIALWGVPSIIVPIADSNGDHQQKNAYNYARSGGAVVIEERNFTPEILLTQIKDIVNNKEVSDKMRAGAKSFAKTDAAEKIAEEIISIGLTHEK